MRILAMMLFLLVGTYLGYAETTATPTEVKQIKNEYDKKNEALKNKININDYDSKMTYGSSQVYVPASNGTYECETGSDGKYYCSIIDYNLPVIQPGMELVKPEGQAEVPNPQQYKNVFKLIVTVMYMFAAVYFLVQIAMEFYRKRYMQALALLMMYLVGSSILYVAYKMVFNAP
jgi:hypothetical protein